MNKTFKRIIALVLSFIMLMSVSAACFSVFAEDEDTAVTTTVLAESEESDEHDAHPTFFAMAITFWKEIFSFLKYIFYDVFRGLPAPEAPTLAQ